MTLQTTWIFCYRSSFQACSARCVIQHEARVDRVNWYGNSHLVKSPAYDSYRARGP